MSEDDGLIETVGPADYECHRCSRGQCARCADPSCTCCYGNED